MNSWIYRNANGQCITCPRRSISDFFSFFIAYTLPVDFSLQILTWTEITYIIKSTPRKINKIGNHENKWRDIPRRKHLGQWYSAIQSHQPPFSVFVDAYTPFPFSQTSLIYSSCLQQEHQHQLSFAPRCSDCIQERADIRRFNLNQWQINSGV